MVISSIFPQWLHCFLSFKNSSTSLADIVDLEAAFLVVVVLATIITSFIIL
uniref:Uncharacterized protein n=1 Tax=virus sp. ctE0n6 TaxID=2827985 RepID=A0A8S5RFR6_9VIRU|nr:MAG TPA: hypothetical protein [virus sp. ctE0n6]